MSDIGNKIRETMLGALSKRESIEHEIEQKRTGDFDARMALFVKLEKWRRELEDALKFCKSETANLSPLLMEEMAERNIQNMRVDGLNVHTRTSFYCSKKSNAEGATPERICEVLRRLGMGEIVSEGYAAASLKAKVKEWLDTDVAIPADLNELINYGETTQLATVK